MKNLTFTIVLMLCSFIYSNAQITIDFTSDYSTSNSCNIPLSVNFSDQSTSSMGNIVAWQWDFGDGITSTVNNPTHIFASTGSYTICLTVTDDGANSDTSCKDNYIIVGSSEDFSISCEDIDISCVEDPISINEPAVSNACGAVTFAFTDVVNNQGCDGTTITRTWAATDENGNTLSCVQNINVSNITLGDISFPGDLDDFINPALDCNNANTEPSNTGYPTVDGIDIDADVACNIATTYEDVLIDNCDGTYKILRTWTALDWCTGNVMTQIQVIKVNGDGESIINCPSDMVVNVDPLNCTASVVLPIPEIEGNCSATVDYTTSGSSGTITNGVLHDLGVGAHTVTYTIYPDCDIETSCSFTILVEGETAVPVAVCDALTQVSLNASGTATVSANVFDDGSYSSCSGGISFTAKRLDSPDCEGNVNDSYADSVNFYCCDAGSVVLVELRVADAAGNTNFCVIEVIVEDKLAPVLFCGDAYLVETAGEVAVVDFGPPFLASDNCGDAEITSTHNSGDEFPLGVTEVTHTAVDASGNTATCNFEVVVFDEDVFSIYTANQVNVSCNGATDGFIQVYWGGGNYNQPVNFTLSGGPGQVGAGGITGLAAGDYSITVTDQDGLEATQTFTITESDALDITANITDPNCSTGTGGSIVASVIGGTPPYIYSLNGFNNGGNNEFTGLDAGQYELVVMDAIGCTNFVSITLVNTGSSNTTLACNENVVFSFDQNCEALITADAILEGSCYNYEEMSVSLTDVDGNELPNPVVLDLINQDIQVTITHIPSGNSCWSTIRVEDKLAPVIVCPDDIVSDNVQVFWDDAQVFDNCAGVDFTVTHNSGDIFPVGTTVVTYTAYDLFGNTSTCSFNVIVDDPNVSFSMTASHESGDVGETVCVSINVQDFFNMEAAQWVLGYNTSVLDYIGAQNITLVGAENDILELNEGLIRVLWVTPNGQPVTIPNDSPAIFEVCFEIISGNLGDSYPIFFTNDPGNPGFETEFVRDNGVVITDYTLVDGSITITECESNDVLVCNDNVVFSVGSNCEALITADAILEGGCYNYDDMSVSLTDENGNQLPNPVVADLLDQDIIATVTHIPSGNTCWSTIRVEDKLAPAIVCPSDIISNNAQVFWNDPQVLDNCPAVDFNGTHSSGDIFPVGTTVVTYTAYDLFGNTSTCSFTVTVISDNNPFSINLQTTDVTCYGDSDGAMLAEVEGDFTAPLMYSLNGVAFSGPEMGGLAAGNYTLAITDENGQGTTVLQDFIISEPSEIQVEPIIEHPTCGMNNGSIDLTVTGGTAPYTFSFDGINISNAVFTDLGAGTYVMVVTDANGCENSLTVTLEEQDEPSTLICITGLIVPVDEDILITPEILLEGDYCNYEDMTVVLEDGNGNVIPNPLTSEFANLTIQYELTDQSSGNNCFGIIETTINNPCTETLACNAFVNVSMNVDCEVMITAEMLLEGNYCNSDNLSLSIVDADNNAVPNPITYEQVGQTLSYSLLDETNGNQCWGNLSVEDQLAPAILCPDDIETENPQVFWSIAQVFDNCSQTIIDFTHSPGDIFPIGTTTVVYTATDIGGNTATCSFNVTVIDNGDLSLDIPSVVSVCHDENVAIVDLNVSGGTAPYTYTVNDGVVQDLVSSIELPLGLHTITIMDSAGNTISQDVAVNQYTNTTYSLTVTNVGCNNLGGIVCFPNNPSCGDYEILWSNGQEDFELIELPAGTYSFTLTDCNGCVYTDEVTITEDDETPIADAGTDQTITCDNPSVTLDASASSVGVEYTYNWTGPNGFSSMQLNPMVNSAGIYILTVTNIANGCASVDLVNVTLDTDIDAPIISPNTAICIGQSLQLMVEHPDAVSYNWTPAIGLSCSDCPNPVTSPDATITYQATIIDANGCQGEAFVTITVDDDCVWPGDTDVNNVVDNFDLLNVGLAWGASGPARDNQSINWMEIPAMNWGQTTPSSEVDYKHIDTDGNGMINSDDTLAIINNWGETHNFVSNPSGVTPPTTSATTMVPFYVGTDTLEEGTMVSLPVLLGDMNIQVEGLYGLAFTIDYDPAIVVPGSPYLSYENSWIGSINDDMIAIEKDFTTTGRLAVGITRIDGMERTGMGEIAHLNFIIKDDILLTGSTTREDALDVVFNIIDVRLIRYDEVEIPVGPTPTTSVIVDVISSTYNPDLANRIDLFPNPVKHNMTIDAHQLMIERYEIYDMTGRMVSAKTDNNHQLFVNTHQFVGGTYFIKLYTEEGLCTKKFIVLK